MVDVLGDTGGEVGGERMGEIGGKMRGDRRRNRRGPRRGSTATQAARMDASDEMSRDAVVEAGDADGTRPSSFSPPASDWGGEILGDAGGDEGGEGGCASAGVFASPWGRAHTSQNMYPSPSWTSGRPHLLQDDMRLAFFSQSMWPDSIQTMCRPHAQRSGSFALGGPHAPDPGP